MKVSVTVSLAAVAFVMATSNANAQTAWPNRTVTVVVPVNAGGGADPQVRTVADGLSKILGQPFVIDFRPGAAMMIGASAVAKSKPDGYTIMFSASTALVNAAVNPSATYDPVVDLMPVTRVTGAATYISANSNVPFNTYEELIDFAKANPGKVNVGVAGIGSSGHYSMSLVESKTGVKFNMVPYTGAGAILPDLMSGTLDITFGNATGYISAVKSGKAKYIASMSETRSSLLPEVPAIGETKYPEAYNDSWYALTVPKGTPKDILQKLHDATVSVLKDAEVIKRINALGFDVIGDTPETMAKVIKDEIAEMKGLIDAGVIQLQ